MRDRQRNGVEPGAGAWLALVLLAAVLPAGCGEAGEQLAPGEAESGRWYDAGQVAAGAMVFAAHCAECHGAAAEGIADDWRERLPDGSFPPPPLNGSAHAWHHPLPVLLQVIDEGGIALGGQMPAFADVLAEDEKLAAIAWFQNFWSNETYAQWQMMGGAD